MNPTTNPLQGYQNTMQTYAQGVQNYPTNQANYINQQIGNTNLTGASNQYGLDYNTFSQMFQNDPMGQQYMAQNFNNAGAVGSPTGTPVNSTAPTSTPSVLQGIIPNAPNLTAPTVTSTLPQLTPQNVMSGWQGFTNPVYAAEGRNQSLANVSGVMNAIQGLIGTDWNDIQAGATAEGQKQQSALQGLLSLAGMYMNMYNAQASASGGSGATTGQLTQEVAQSIDNDARNHMTLQALMQKYAGSGPGQADANYVLQQYNKYNYIDPISHKQVGYGPAKQSMDFLSQTYGVNPKSFANPPAKTQTIGTGANKKIYAYNSKTGNYDIDVTPKQQGGGFGDWLNSIFNFGQDTGSQGQTGNQVQTTAQQSGKTLMQDPNGNKYWVPNDQVNEAVKNKWRKING